MRIVIDMQGAQTASRYRGIGRYTLSFALAVARNRGDHEIILAMSGAFPETIEPVRSLFQGVLPQKNIRVWYAPGPVRACETDNTHRRNRAELVREAFLASLDADIIHVSSMIEGFGDDAVVSIGRFDQKTPISVTIYDFIPLLNPDHYLETDPAFKRFYLEKIEQLAHADQYFAISDSSRSEGLQQLDAPSDRFVNISSAAGPEFQQWDIDSAAADALLNKLSIHRPFVLFSGGADERKNLRRLIEAFALLPMPLRKEYQLVLAGKMAEGTVRELQHHAHSVGLATEKLCFTGHVTDHDLISLYNLCSLYVFPSWHEGFGLPVLEAMACGAPVIGSNTSSLPEVIAFEKAMFDPFDTASISQKMAETLKSESFREELKAHGLRQAKKFSWDRTARQALSAWEQRHSARKKDKASPLPSGGKPTLAFVSPMPPERTGIAGYSADLLPELSRYYNLELIVTQPETADEWIKERFSVRDVAWLKANASQVDRVIYQMGNSTFHDHMLVLINEVPGVVVLHDFYLSGLMEWRESQPGHQNAWVRELYQAHGYHAVKDRFEDAEAAKFRYPSNFDVIRNAQGVIVHSEYSRNLARDWYGDEHARALKVIPLVRTPPESIQRAQARKQLGIGDNEFLICSFGLLDSTKMNHRLLESWLQSSLAGQPDSKLVFVGHSPGNPYDIEIQKSIKSSGRASQIEITGYVSDEHFRLYLMAADVAVQLRTQSRGETSAAVLDCMANSLPVIVNANGSMAELDSQAVWLLDDDFADSDLIEALETLKQDAEKRVALGKAGRDIILKRHTPKPCAKQYAEAIESFHCHANTGRNALIQAMAGQAAGLKDSELIPLAQDISVTLPLPKSARTIFLDVTATSQNDLKTGIERVARSVVMNLLADCPQGFRIEPVYLCREGDQWRHRSASRFTLEIMGCPQDALSDEIVEPQPGDILLGLDLSGERLCEATYSGLFADYRNRGVRVYFTIFDLLPVTMPDVFPSGAREQHIQWLRAVSSFDGAICISRTVADELARWLRQEGLNHEGRRPFSIDWFHLGADVAASSPSFGLPKNAGRVLKLLQERPTFLTVGTIEPRKAHLQTLEAFERLWAEGVDINLVIVGHEGWKGLPAEEREQITNTVRRVESHPELGRRLFWLAGISDEYLEKIYSASTCLIASSYGEGFGLPLIEAAQHQLPVIARDISVFREVGGEAPWFYRTGADLPEAIEQWLRAYREGSTVTSTDIPCLTWKESTANLAAILLTPET